MSVDSWYVCHSVGHSGRHTLAARALLRGADLDPPEELEQGPRLIIQATLLSKQGG